MEGLQDTIVEWGALYGTKVIGAIIILVVGRLLTTFFANFVVRVMEKSRADHTVCTSIDNIIAIIPINGSTAKDYIWNRSLSFPFFF